MKEDNTSIPWIEKGASAIKPATSSCEISTLTVPAAEIDKFWKEANTQLHQYYQKGIIVSKGNISPNEHYEKVLDITIICFFQCLRDAINSDDDVTMETKQSQLVQLSSVEGIFKSAVQVLKSLQIKLDLNSVICILQGCINESALQISEKYERRHST
jgi:hypothetical protein